MNNFDFLSPVASEVVGIMAPPLRLPTGLAFAIAHVLELCYALATLLTAGCIEFAHPSSTGRALNSLLCWASILRSDRHLSA